jgi:hypothetical protein
MNADLERMAAATAKPLDHPTPAPRLADLLDETSELIDRYVALPRKDVSMLVAVWIASTYLYLLVRFCGYLALRSATPRCGKSRLLSLVAALSNGEPPVTANPSAASLFRRTRPVLILDEVDRLRNADKETFGDVLAVLNVGFEFGGCVERVEKTKGGAFEVRQFPVYGPVALAGIEKLADTLDDRAFSIQMKRAPQRLPRLNRRRLAETAARLREGFAAWAEHHGQTVENVYNALPDELPDLTPFDDRFQDISEPLVVLSTLADAERANGAPPILPRLLAGLRAAAGHREPSGRERELSALLALIEDRLPPGADEVFLTSASLVEDFRDHPDLSRIETGRALAGLLKHFDCAPVSTGKVRGYNFRRSWIEEWRGRYRTTEPGEEGGISRQGSISTVQSVKASETRSSSGQNSLLEVSEPNQD